MFVYFFENFSRNELQKKQSFNFFPFFFLFLLKFISFFFFFFSHISLPHDQKTTPIPTPNPTPSQKGIRCRVRAVLRFLKIGEPVFSKKKQKEKKKKLHRLLWRTFQLQKRSWMNSSVPRNHLPLFFFSSKKGKLHPTFFSTLTHPPTLIDFFDNSLSSGM